ncbi:hypothetical protein KMW40_12090 [Enterobacter cloacae]|uniref:hypothetical protein n=1 Tax=Enterobacter cloacae TaxID=550 RepID=UPI0034A4CE11
MTNSIIKIEALKVAISRTKHGVTRINDVVRDVNTVWVDAGEPYPLPVGEYKRRAWLLADLERMLAQLVDEAHAEALEMNAKCSAKLANEIMFCDDHRSLFDKCDPYVRGLMIADAHSEALRANELLDTSALVVLNNRDAWKSASATVKKLAVSLAHSEAQEEDYRFNWLHNRWCLFHSSSRQQQEEIIAIAWEQARHIIEAEEEYNSQKKWKLEAIWKHTHRDYKGERDGVRSILVCRNGTISVPLECLTDKEIEQRSSMWQRNK